MIQGVEDDLAGECECRCRRPHAGVHHCGERGAGGVRWSGLQVSVHCDHVRLLKRTMGESQDAAWISDNEAALLMQTYRDDYSGCRLQHRDGNLPVPLAVRCGAMAAFEPAVHCLCQLTMAQTRLRLGARALARTGH